MKTDIKLDEKCSVVLTQRGADILNNRMPPDAYKFHEGDVCTLPLGEIMHEFGIFIYDGCVTPFKDDMVHFIGETIG